ncbi:MAG: hypothetical protein BMS9Abin29_1185 [Gemmatimonadota bacterium]|nr:MAG: hypothetical protein BMS9Abin29_1185 [Gemmatimonadota bacterium]
MVAVRHVSCTLCRASAVPGFSGAWTRAPLRSRTREYMILRRLLTFVIAGALPMVGPRSVEGQNVTLDEGAFVINVEGRRVATETFRIRRSGQGEAAVVIAQATLAFTEGDIESITTLLQARGRNLELTGYQVRVSTGEVTSLRDNGQRLEAVTTSSTGQREREYRGGIQAVVLEELVAHHYYFLGRRARPEPTSVSVIVPRTGSQARASLIQGNVETVQVAGTRVSAQRLTLDVLGRRHDFWVDRQNRVLRVEITADAYVAVRRELP